jgi:hypothetical protein
MVCGGSGMSRGPATHPTINSVPTTNEPFQHVTSFERTEYHKCAVPYSQSSGGACPAPAAAKEVGAWLPGLVLRELFFRRIHDFLPVRSIWFNAEVRDKQFYHVLKRNSSGREMRLVL